MTYAGYAIIKVTNNTSTDLTDFQVKLTLDSNNFQYWEALRDDGIDIYFTLTDGLTEVPFWRESFDKINKQATFWIKVPSVAANSYTTLYMYFVNPNETIDRSNGTQTFEFFDDFDNLDNWTILDTDGTGTASISNSQLVLTSPDTNNAISVCHQFSVTPNPVGYIIGVKATGLSTTNGFALYYGDGTGKTTDILASNCYAGGYFQDENTKHYIGKEVNSEYTRFTDISASASPNDINYVEFGWYSNILISRDFTHNIQLKASDSTTFNSFNYIHLATWNGKWIFDYIYVRKYMANLTNIDKIDPLFEPLTATIEDVTLTLRTVSATLTLNNVQQYVDTFIGDGSTTTFTLSKKPIPKVRVFIDGIEVDETKVVIDYTSGMITLSTAPTSNSTVSIVYYYGDCNFIPNATIKVLINNTEIDSVTTDQYGRYTVKVPINIEVGLKAETNKLDSITIVKLTE